MGIIRYALSALIWIIVFRVILSWIRIDPYSNLILKLIYEISETLIAPIRRILPPVGMFDFSPMVVILLLEVVRRII
ncbi:MAG: YggT family protein [Firmicutes bacterium]|nr:YggT family protein [Bacillota bacterium]MDD4264668.1 YggT family protein [Bacillota bacterium]MDD4694758.1 YggT family protein [Bacillota bacterium]